MLPQTWRVSHLCYSDVFLTPFFSLTAHPLTFSLVLTSFTPQTTQWNSISCCFPWLWGFLLSWQRKLPAAECLDEIITEKKNNPHRYHKMFHVSVHSWHLNKKSLKSNLWWPKMPFILMFKLFYDWTFCAFLIIYLSFFSVVFFRGKEQDHFITDSSCGLFSFVDWKTSLEEWSCKKRIRPL